MSNTENMFLRFCLLESSHSACHLAGTWKIEIWGFLVFFFPLLSLPCLTLCKGRSERRSDIIIWHHSLSPQLLFCWGNSFNWKSRWKLIDWGNKWVLSCVFAIHLGRVCVLQRRGARSCGSKEVPLDCCDVISLHSGTVVPLLLTTEGWAYCLLKCGSSIRRRTRVHRGCMTRVCCDMQHKLDMCPILLVFLSYCECVTQRPACVSWPCSYSNLKLRSYLQWRKISCPGDASNLEKFYAKVPAS